MFSVIAFFVAVALPLFTPTRALLVGVLSLAAVLTLLTIWSLWGAISSADDAVSTRFAAVAIIGLITGAVIRLGVFLRGANLEEKALREKLGRDLPQRYR